MLCCTSQCAPINAIASGGKSCLRRFLARCDYNRISHFRCDHNRICHLGAIPIAFSMLKWRECVTVGIPIPWGLSVIAPLRAPIGAIASGGNLLPSY